MIGRMISAAWALAAVVGLAFSLSAVPSTAATVPSAQADQLLCGDQCMLVRKTCMTDVKTSDVACKVGCPTVPPGCGKQEVNGRARECIAARIAASTCGKTCRSVKTNSKVTCYEELASCLTDCRFRRP